MPVLDFGQPMKSIIQTAFVTDDIQTSMRDMTRLLNIGPWFLFENFKLHDLTYHGKPADFELTLALGNV
ncbi:MAG: VOC family protein, partial [Pseudomonadota bacterium]